VRETSLAPAAAQSARVISWRNAFCGDISSDLTHLSLSRSSLDRLVIGDRRLMGDQGAARQVELAAGRQHVDHSPLDQQGGGAFGCEGIGHQVLAVNDCDRAAADHLEPIAVVDHRRCILINSQAEQ